MTYYMIAADGRQIGPIEAEELIKHGLNNETLVWCQNFTQWVPASQVPELIAMLNAAYTATQTPPYNAAPNSYGYNQNAAPQAPQPQYQNQQGQWGNNPNNPAPQHGTVGFGEAIKICFSKYADFKGRAPRAEYWWFFLFNLILAFIPIVNLSAPLVLLIPSLAVAWRRLHDIGKGGGWYFIGLIPIVGAIILLVWYCTEGEKHPNRFGPNPYGINDGMPAKN